MPNEKPTESDVHNAFRVIIRNRQAKALNYAIEYAKAGLRLNDHALEVQVLYVLNNMSHWRGSEATSVRTTLKAFAKGR